MAEFASKGVAEAGLGLGIAGTALGLLNGGAGLTGLFGGNSRNVGEGFVTEKEQFYINEMNKKDAELSQQRSERYADNIGIETYKEESLIYKEWNEKKPYILDNIFKLISLSLQIYYNTHLDIFNKII